MTSLSVSVTRVEGRKRGEEKRAMISPEKSSSRSFFGAFFLVLSSIFNDTYHGATNFGRSHKFLLILFLE